MHGDLSEYNILYFEVSFDSFSLGISSVLQGSLEQTREDRYNDIVLTLSGAPLHN